MSNSSLQFQANDRWCAVGDSITHGGWYHHYIHLYHATRHPEMRLDMFNCGNNGDSAPRVLVRLEDDVLIHRPTVATVLLGMNDVDRELYVPGRTGPEVEAGRKKTFEVFRANLRKVLSRIQRTGARMIVMTPTIYDETLVHEGAEASRPGMNGALGRCGSIATELAGEFGAAVVDIHGPMAEWNAQLQSADPAATLVGMDRVHPGEPGHLVMAYEILKAQGVNPIVSAVTLDGRSGEVWEAISCNIQGMQRRPGVIEFDCLETALPFPVPAGCAEALKLVPFTRELNQEMLRVERLVAGSYELQIDGTVINTYSSEQLQEGVNLAMEQATPQCRQARELLELETRHATVYGSLLRCIASMEWGYLEGSDVDRRDLNAVKAVMDGKIELERHQPWYDFCKSEAVRYRELKPHEAEYWEEIAGLADEIYRRNRPAGHRYALVRVMSPSASGFA